MEYFESSSSLLKPSHVYMSFRGDDDGTRKFVQSLSAALKAQGFRIFGDDKSVERPDDSYLPDHLLQEIRKSWIWIVVFSKNYFSSSLCLQELAGFGEYGRPVARRSQSIEIYEPETRFEAYVDKLNRWWRALTRSSHLSGPRSAGERVIAVFYDEIDLESLAPHIRERYREVLKKGFSDSPALNDEPYLSQQFERILSHEICIIKEVASLSGWHVRNDSGSLDTQKIVEEVVKQVKSKMDKQFYDYFGFVGIQSQVEEVEKLLELSTAYDEVRVVGICGMGGLGKTSIAAVLYLKIFHRFDAFCFLPNVSGRLKHGDLSLQQLLLRHLRTENSEIWHILGQEFLACKMLRNYKFLIVLDGVDHVQHLRELNLVENSNCFGGGSRIIITTRDEQVLQKYDVDTVYRPKFLSKDEALQLFRSRAFLKQYPIQDFEGMIDKVLAYANGLPLAIEMLGSSLFGKSVEEWRSFLDREEIIPPYEIITVLRKSFDELDDMSREMFLDIACFFVGKDIHFVKEILHDCFSCSVDMELLIQKSLITIANRRIQMHGILKAMGREIVRRECPNHPDGRSRLYLFTNIKHVMEEAKMKQFKYGKEEGTIVLQYVKEERRIVPCLGTLKAIALDMEEPNRVPLSAEHLSFMRNLRLLIFRNVKFSGTLHNLSRKLRYVSWHQYPFTGLPSRFQSDTLVQLIMAESNMTEVWKGKMMLPKLRKMNLSSSKTLTKTPDFGGVPNLERLELEGCTGLLELDASIAQLSKLKFLNLRGCINIDKMPNSLFSLDSLEVLNLAGCSKLAYSLEFFPLKRFIQMNKPSMSKVSDQDESPNRNSKLEQLRQGSRKRKSS